MANAGAAPRLLDAARAFRPRIVAERERIERERRLPQDLAHDLARAGFFRMFLPDVYGGLDLTPTEAMDIYEEFARADASVAWCVWNGNVNWTTVRLPKETVQDVFGDPEVIVANSTRPSGKAEIVEGGYRVSGRWSLVSGCQLSRWMMLMCIVHEGGTPRLTAGGVPESRFMFCPAAACKIIDTWTTSGLRGTGSHDVTVDDCFVPTRHGSFHTDPFVLGGPRYEFPFFARITPGVGAMALGVAAGAIETLIDLGGGKRHERTGQPLGEDRGAQTRLAQAEALVHSARLFLFDAVTRLWDGALAGREPTMEGRVLVRLATWHAATSAAQAVDLVYLTGGATSLYATCAIEHAFRDVHAFTQHIAVHPRVLETAGRVLFGLEPDIPKMMV
jgi:alkylation response protein AidB-like acyl-CoA dehydrogenase